MQVEVDVSVVTPASARGQAEHALIPPLGRAERMRETRERRGKVR